MPHLNKAGLKNISAVKKAAFIGLLLAIILLGLFLGAFVKSRSNNKIFKGTFVSNYPVIFRYYAA